MKYWLDTEFIEDGKTIDLISIGIVAEDGREYYAQSVEYDESKASEWVKEHVLETLPLCPCCGHKCNHEDQLTGQCRSKKCMWRTRAAIRDEVLTFLDAESPTKLELWGYYSAYDHVAFCQLFGTMMDLPQGFPMYTRDIKQWCDMLGNPRLPEQGKGEHHALEDARWNKRAWEFLASLTAEGQAEGGYELSEADIQITHHQKPGVVPDYFTPREIDVPATHETFEAQILVTTLARKEMRDPLAMTLYSQSHEAQRVIASGKYCLELVMPSMLQGKPTLMITETE